MLVDRSGRVWAMRPDEAMVAEAAALRAARQNGHATTAVAPFAGAQLLDGSNFAVVVGGVAIVRVRGMLLRQMSGAFWSYEEIARDVALAQADRGVRGIVLDIDSPGGMVAGCSDLATLLRGAGGKPVEAFAGGLCTSAAYWLAAASRRVTLGSGAVVGSVGTVIEYVDIEPMLERMGARIVRVVAQQSPNKRLSPDSDEGRAEMQAIVDASCAEFVAGVAGGRGVTEAEVLDRFGQGLVFGASEALARGMADRRGTLFDLVAEMAGRDPTGGAAPAAAAREEHPMDWAAMTSAELREHRADIVTELTAAAVAAERERLIAIDEIAVAGHEALVAAAKRDGTGAADLALQIVRAEKAAGAAHLRQRERDDTAVAVPAAAPAQPAAATGTIEDRCKAAWSQSADLQAEFGGDFAAYLAFEKALAAGTARLRAA